MPSTVRNVLHRRWPIFFGDIATPAVAVENGSTTSHTRIEWERAVVLSVARGIEPDVDKVMHWFSSEAICELGGKTARQLVEEGLTARLLDMLVTIRNGYRDR
jgi:hypothetical protein